MITIELSHGGSGDYGNSAYKDRANGCPEYRKLSAEYPTPCVEVYKPSASGPNAMLVGSLVHAYVERELTHGPLDQDALIRFIDSQCQWEPPQDAQDEAHRVYWGWVSVRKDWGAGETLGAELLLEADFGGIKAQAKIDHLVRDPDGVVCLEDFKTASRSGDNYTSGATRLQMQSYVMVAWTNGYDVQRIRIRQIVKTKMVQEHIIDTLDLPTPDREQWIRRYWAGALARESLGATGPWGGGCDFCRFAKNLQCKL